MTTSDRDTLAALALGLSTHFKLMTRRVPGVGDPADWYVYHELVGEWQEALLALLRLGVSLAADPKIQDGIPFGFADRYPDGATDGFAVPVYFSLPDSDRIATWRALRTTPPFTVDALLVCWLKVTSYGRDPNILPKPRGTRFEAAPHHRPVLDCLAARGLIRREDALYSWTDLAFPVMAKANEWDESVIDPAQVDPARCAVLAEAIFKRLNAGDEPSGLDRPLLHHGIGERAVVIRTRWGDTGWTAGPLGAPTIGYDDALTVSARLWQMD